MIFDAHTDLLYDVTARRLAGESRVLARRHLPLLRRGGVEGVVLALWASAAKGTFWRGRPEEADHWRRTQIMMDCAAADLAECPDIQIVSTAEEAAAARAAGKIYAFFAVEGMETAGGDLERIDAYARWGARIGMLTWNEANALAAGAASGESWGLTDLGRQAVRRMQALGMLLDVSHLNGAGFRDVIGMAQGPVIASHSNCRALCPAVRNLTDDQLRAIRDTGGVVGLNAYVGFVSQDPARQTAEELARHAAHMLEVCGVDHVGLGFDFCWFMGQPGNEAVRGLEDASKAGTMLRCLKALGLTAEETERVARGNFLRLLAAG